MVTVIHGSTRTDIPDAQGADGALWLSATALERATGWALKSEGLCRGEVCVPVSPAQRTDFLRDDAINVAALWALLHRPALHSTPGDLWVLGEAATERGAQLASLEAPDFRLPDLQGRLHALSEHRGRKVLLATWASW